jgi:DNA polymerase bacteriophage-type
MPMPVPGVGVFAIPKPVHHLHLDFETYCDLDLKRVGIHRYVRHRSFQVLCAGWVLDGGTPEFVTASLLEDVAKLVADARIQTHAWNAAFETAVLEGLGFSIANPLSCTMQRALAYGLPAGLAAAGAALGVPIQKSQAGHRLMMRLCRPDKAGLKPIPLPTEWVDLGNYCATDAAAEASIAAVIPELQPEEKALSELDALMNTSGLYVDRQRVGTLKAAAILADAEDATRCTVLTGGMVTSPGTQTARLLHWLQGRGLSVPDVARNTIEEALDLEDENLLPGHEDVLEVLQIRLRTAKGSVKKLDRMLDMADGVGRLCYQFQFCGAARTGRWSGRGIQLQNLPRIPAGFDPDLFVSMAAAAMTSTAPKALNAVTPAPVLDCVSQSLRSCLRAGVGEIMWSFDFSQIEARVLAWLADQQDVLQTFRSGQDVYVWAAQQFGSTNRQLGKVLILALGFGMGATKLRETAKKQYGVNLSVRQAEIFKTAWRQRNHRIVEFWENMAFAARQAIMMRGRVFGVIGSGIAFICTPRTLQMRLPSGRVLYYHKPRLDHDGAITYWGMGLSGWEEQRTYGGKLAENATQAVARDVMGEAMLRIYRRTNAVPLMTVHDELVYGMADSSRPAVLFVAEEYQRFALEAPPWAGGLPIAGEAKLMTRYGVKI